MTFPVIFNIDIPVSEAVNQISLSEGEGNLNTNFMVIWVDLLEDRRRTIWREGINSPVFSVDIISATYGPIDDVLLDHTTYQVISFCIWPPFKRFHGSGSTQNINIKGRIEEGTIFQVSSISNSRVGTSWIRDDNFKKVDTVDRTTTAPTFNRNNPHTVSGCSRTVFSLLW